MEEKRLKNADIAKILNITGAALTKWKNGAMPTIDKLAILCEYLNVSADELLGLETKPDQPDEISKDEKQLLEHYRKSNEQGKISIMSLAELQSSLNSPNETLSNLNVG